MIGQIKAGKMNILLHHTVLAVTKEETDFGYAGSTMRMMSCMTVL